LRKILVALTLAALFFSCAARGEAYTAGGRWLIEGKGNARKGLLRVSLNTNGTIDIKSAVDADGAETLSGYEAWGYLNASQININAWEYHNEYTLPVPLPIGKFNPSLGEPLELPPFTIDKLTYTIVFTNIDSGTVNIKGYVDVDVAGECEVNADCAIWRYGTPKPEIPDSGGGCNSGLGVCGLIAVSLVFIRAKGSSS
jgi:hypothetical protein